jgi:hypothetical protein
MREERAVLTKKKNSNKEIEEAWSHVQSKTKRGEESNKDLSSMMVDDSEKQEVPKEEKLSELAKAIKIMANLEDEIQCMTDNLKKLDEEYANVQRNIIPDIFDEIGISDFTMADGTKVRVDRDYAASITEANKSEAFAWLEKEGHEDIIKHDVVIKLKKGENETYKEVVNDLQLMGVDFNDKEYVHPLTLKAFVKEQMTNGSDIPQETFGIFPIRITKLKRS